MRRKLLMLLLFLPLAGCHLCPLGGGIDEEDSPRQRRADFDQMWRFVRDHYPSFQQKETDWAAVRELYRPRAAQAVNEQAFVAVLEQALDELYDPHAHLAQPLPSSWRDPPWDIRAEWQEGKAIVTDVRPGSSAARGGVKAGDEVLSIEGEPVAAAAAARKPRCLKGPDPRLATWELLSALSGRRDRERVLELRDSAGLTRVARLADLDTPAAEPAPSWKDLGGGVGYLRLGSLGPSAVGTFDEALEALREEQALELDLRDERSEDVDAAHAIMGRLTDRRQQIGWTSHREGAGLSPRSPDYAEPRGPWTFRGPLAVLVDGWSDGASARLTAGLAAIGRVRFLGAPLLDPGAGASSLVLKHSGVELKIPVELFYRMDGRPGVDLVPELRGRTGSDREADPLLEAAAGLLRSP